MRRRGDAPPVVVHVGVFGELPGGMAQVLNEYLAWDFHDVEVRAVASTHGRGDRWMAARTLRCVAMMLACRCSRRRHAFVLHLSSGGSFVREGGLAALARLLRFPVAVQLHGSDFAEFTTIAPRLIRAVLRVSHRVYVLTAETEQLARAAIGPTGAARMVRIVNGVEVPPQATAVKEPVVLFAGEVGPRKGVDVLFAAWASVRERHPDWRLVVAGPRRSDEPVQVPGDASICLLGPVDREEVLRWATRSAVAVLPSRQEALPMFLIEAMARGCAVVATPVGEVAALVEGCGALVPVGDVDALAEGLHGLLRDPAAAASASASARERIGVRYAAEQVAREVEREWRALLGVREGLGAPITAGLRPRP